MNGRKIPPFTISGICLAIASLVCSLVPYLSLKIALALIACIPLIVEIIRFKGWICKFKELKKDIWGWICTRCNYNFFGVVVSICVYMLFLKQSDISKWPFSSFFICLFLYVLLNIGTVIQGQIRRKRQNEVWFRHLSEEERNEIEANDKPILAVFGFQNGISWFLLALGLSVVISQLVV